MIAIILLTLLPSLALAQDYGVAGSIGVLSTSVYGGTTTFGVGTTVAVVYMVVPAKAEAQLELYLHQNRAHVEQAITLGAGPASAELAQFFGVSVANYPAFATMLRQQRQPLLASMSPEATRADLFISHITKNMRAHPMLRADVRWIDG